MTFDRNVVLNAQPDTQSDSWKPLKLHDYIAGTCLDVDTLETANGPRLVVTINAEKAVSDGEKLPTGEYIVWEKTALKRSIRKSGLKRGDEVLIVYCGEVKTQSGRNVKTFSLKIHQNHLQPEMESTEESEDVVRNDNIDW